VLALPATSRPGAMSLFGSLIGAILALAAPARAEQTVEGMIVPVPSAISTESTNRLKSAVAGPLKRFEAGGSREGGKFTLVCDFNPDGRRANCDDFGAAYTLAKYLRSLSAVRGVSTVAYVRGDVTRHSVLAALACTEVVFAPAGKLGRVTDDRAAGKVEQAAYEEISRDRFPAVLVRKMLDPAPHVEGFGDGETALYDFEKAKKGICQQVASNTLEDVRVAYGLPRTGVSQAIDRSACWRIPVEGVLDGELVEQTQRRIKRALRAGANLLLIELRCAGGRPDKAYELGLFLAKLNQEREEAPVETIAFVTTRARDLALFPALGCTRIVMQKEDVADAGKGDDEDALAHEARLGGFGHYLDKHPDLEAIRRRISRLSDDDGRLPALKVKLDQRHRELQDELRDNLLDLANRQTFPAALVEGFCRREVHVVLAARATGASGRVLLTEDEFRADQRGAKRYSQVMLVKPWQGDKQYENHYLTLTADQARQLGLTTAIVEDFADLCAAEGVTPAEVRAPEADWLDGLAEILKHPLASGILIMIGLTCMILEFKTPGVGLPGVIAAVCFVLFFWAHSKIAGQIDWLAILLFVLGLALIALEVFVLPGFGVCGISGIILLLTSLGLVAYGHWPHSSSDWVAFGEKLSPFGISMLGSLVCVFLIVKYLPHIPILNRLISKTPEELDGTSGQPDLPMHAEYQALLGAIGVAATPLRPAGKAQFGDAFVDVVAEGGYVMPSTRVQVIEVEGNRVVVKEV
jgi:membrane-bound serine protease (ClpP class)